MRILITGASGFIGTHLFDNLLKEGHEVIGLSNSTENPKFIKLDLLNLNEVNNKLKNENFDILIHCAAIAHGQTPPKGESILTANLKMSSNLFQVLVSKCKNVIFLSSVAVYREEGKHAEISFFDKPDPYSAYGKSKLLAEQNLISQGFENTYSLRLAPVFDKKNLTDIKKRIQIPIINSKFITSYERLNSFCSLKTILIAVKSILEMQPKGDWIFLLSDKKVYDQNDIHSLFGSGAVLIFSKKITNLIYSILRIIPFNTGHKIRSLFWKLFQSNTYKNEALNINSQIVYMLDEKSLPKIIKTKLKI